MTVATLAATEEPAPTVAPAVAKATYEFDLRFQRKIVALALRDTIFAQRTDGLVQPSYFEGELEEAVVSVALDFYKTYKKAIDRGSLTAVFKDAIDSKRFRRDLVPDLKRFLVESWAMPIADREYVIDKVADFAKKRAMEQAILTSIPLLEKGNYEKIREAVTKALAVGANDDGSEYDYFGEIDSRTATRVAVAAGTMKPTGITTGYDEIDKHLYHGGWGRCELSALMARAKWGKSMGIGDFAKNASIAGYNVLVCSCEVSAIIYSDRLDASLADTMMRELKLKPFEVRDRINVIKARGRGHLKIHDFASGTLKPSQIRRLIERYRTRGIIFDLICIDYADIMCPERYTDSPIENSKSIWIDLRAIAYEQNAAMLTATQTNREGAKAMVAKATDVAEDYNKVRTADLVISGNANEAEIASGEARLVFAASRNQAEITIQIKQDRAKMRFLTKVLSILT
jgi:replicative DNA helicase